MRLRNFCVHMLVALIIAAIGFLVSREGAVSIFVIVFNLIWALNNARKSTNSEKYKIVLEEKFEENLMPDIQYAVGDKTVVLRDKFVKTAMIDTLKFTDYSAKKKKDKEFLEKFFSAIMFGEYNLEQYIVTKTELVPGNDSPDNYYVYCNGKRFEINHTAYEKCSIGDCIVSVTVNEMPTYSVLILLRVQNNEALVAAKNDFCRMKFLMR